ncbi:MAG: GGDEF domain-containing protein [Rhodospirillaceae bacterium]
MDEIRSIQMQVGRQALALGHRVQLVHLALEEIKTLSEVMIDLTPCPPEAIDAWLETDGFTELHPGFFESKIAHEAFTRGTLCPNAITVHWPMAHRNTEPVRALFYALRTIGPQLARVKASLEGVSILYYQNVEHSSALAFPYFDMSKVIPADFDWKTYHAFLSIAPEVNPEGAIRWSSPNIDYAGEGLISIASIPVVKQGKLCGLWSMDVPHHTIHRNCVVETLLRDQVSFISDFAGNLIIHPTIETTIDKEKGAFYQGTLRDLGGGFPALDLAGLVSTGQGIVNIVDASGAELALVYEVIPGIDWILVSCLPREGMVDLAMEKISRSFETMKGRQSTSTIDLRIDNELQALVDSFNDMVGVIQYHQEKQEKAQQETLEYQRILNEELEQKVTERTKELSDVNAALIHMANHDPLTGIFNRRYFFDAAGSLLSLQRRESKPVCLLMMDIDFFKSINDQHGHHMGDRVLKGFAESVTDVIRTSDIFARYGGEEFVLLLPSTPIEDSLILAERIRVAVANSAGTTGIAYTVSIGAADFDGDLDESLQRADAALYRAKTRGRNRVEAVLQAADS